MSQDMNDDIDRRNDEMERVYEEIIQALPNLKEKIDIMISNSQDIEANKQLQALGDYIDEVLKRFNSLSETTNPSARSNILNEIGMFYQVIRSYMPEKKTD
ncbi:MAG: hypothetical protein WCF96_05375 [Eubacteriales bacterium]